MFLSDSCILDPNSGAAMEMLAWLQVLQARGCTCYSVTMSLFDGAAEFPIRKEIFPDVDMAQTAGQRIRTVVQGIEHNIFNAGTTIGAKVAADMVKAFVAAAAEDIRRIRPDVVIGYGMASLVPLRQLAKSLGARTLFYLCNLSYGAERRACLDAVDRFVVPSRAVGQHYEDLHGITGWAVVRTRIVPPFDRRALSRDLFLSRRRHGFVTMINPTLSKGGAVFLQIANQTRGRLPNVTFLAVESRGTRAAIEAQVNNANLLTNLWWIQRQRDMRPVYRRTALLLVPSLWFEAAGRVVAEAQASGIPVLATDNGGIPEQLNGGGFLFPRPDAGPDFRTLPSAETVMPWVDRIVEMLAGTDAAYLAACDRALAAAEMFRPQEIDEAIASVVCADQPEVTGTERAISAKADPTVR